jgi:hypothetical protein
MNILHMRGMGARNLAIEAPRNIVRRVDTAS